MTEIERLRRKLTQVGDLMLATTSVVEELVRITHAANPQAVEAYLRRRRIAVQEVETERSILENRRTLRSHQAELRLLERALGRGEPHATSAP